MRDFKMNGQANKMANIRFCGFGGQGILLSGFIFGTAAVIDGNKVLQTQSYGSESRGGGCRSDVVISGEEIHDLAPARFDALIALSQSAYDTYINSLHEDGLLVVDEDLVNPEKAPTAGTYRVKATEIAHKKIGNKLAANMVMMGFTSAVLESVSKESLQQAIGQYVSRDTSELNLQAFEEGYRLGKEQSSR
jgi:2-oxoglutarate ferredoxin oxidoreductase subunit gamma